MTITDYVLLAAVVLLMLVCWSLIRQLTQAEKQAKNWRQQYFQSRKEAQDLFSENIELKAKAKQK